MNLLLFIERKKEPRADVNTVPSTSRSLKTNNRKTICDPSRQQYYSVLNGNEVPSHETDVEERTLLTERRQPEKATDCRVLTTWHSGKGTTRDSKGSGVAGVREQGRMDRQSTEDF